MARKKTLVTSSMRTQATDRVGLWAGLIFQFASLPELAPSHRPRWGLPQRHRAGPSTALDKVLLICFYQGTRL